MPRAAREAPREHAEPERQQLGDEHLPRQMPGIDGRGAAVVLVERRDPQRHRNDGKRRQMICSAGANDR